MSQDRRPTIDARRECARHPPCLFMFGSRSGLLAHCRQAHEGLSTTHELMKSAKNELARFPLETEPDRLFEGDEEFYLEA
ncbi:hypothetical protein ACQKKX_00455 [Neorhizobium sp. NPDC001467]|uniref:hypothetical protein n=1 Tax=Neorhizobium sp. NPDC001467 TaxID=3390595 RepID=UPI003CFC610C